MPWSQLGPEIADMGPISDSPLAFASLAVAFLPPLSTALRDP